MDLPGGLLQRDAGVGRLVVPAEHPHVAGVAVHDEDLAGVGTLQAVAVEQAGLQGPGKRLEYVMNLLPKLSLPFVLQLHALRDEPCPVRVGDGKTPKYAGASEIAVFLV